jgi:histidine triad (HIT) family protein
MADCLFCKIRDGQIPAKIVHRDEVCLGFEDIRPEAPVHILFIPLEHIPTVNDLTSDHADIVGRLFLAAARVAKERGYKESGYRLVMNTLGDAGQTVFHIHLHLLAGRQMTWPPG